MSITQRNRAAAIETSLGPDVLVLKSFSGTEQLGRLFEFELELLSEDYNLDFDKLIGEAVTIRLTLGQRGMRYFHGKVRRLVQLPAEGGYARYQATVVPWVWLLTRAADCRIFQNKTVPDIIEEVFKAHGFDDYERRLSGTYQPWEYCVQYRETDFNFVSRLMEQEGIYYYFKHQQGKHLLVLADSPGAHEDFPGYEEIAYRPPDETDTKTEYIRQWTIQKELQTGTYAHTEFNFTKPKTDLQQKASQSRAHAHADLEVFDYPGEYEETNEGENYAKIRMQEIQIGYETLRGHSDSHGLCSGQTFKLTEFPRQDQNRKYLIHSVTHSIEVDVFESGKAGKSGAVYECTFTVRPADEQYRPARLTRKPIVQGPQTAIVVGPAGEEIYTDKHGRIKVHFHWDRHDKFDENSSCWIRVSQNWAGKKWGSIYTPRIGQEVIIDFLEGDPDQPIITGRVYNGESMPPYDLPANATLSTLKSLSSKGGGGFNEIRFEDKKGEEQIFIHGEKNLDIRIKNDAFETIGNDQHIDVKKDQHEHVENNRNEVVGVDHKEQIGNDRNLKVGGKEAKDVGGSLSLTVTGDVIEVFKGNHSEQTTQNLYIKAMGIVIEAMTGLTLKCGANSVVIDPVGVTVKGTMVTLDGVMVMIASGPGSPAMSGQAGSAVAPAAPAAAAEADKADPGSMASVKAQQRQTKSGKYGSTPLTPHKPPQTEEEREQKKHWIEIVLVDKDNKPVPGEAYRITLPDGTTVAQGTLDEKGFARVDGIDPGTCKVTFPKLEKQAWKPK